MNTYVTIVHAVYRLDMAAGRFICGSDGRFMTLHETKECKYYYFHLTISPRFIYFKYVIKS